MDWIAFGNCIVAAALLCAVAAICIYALRILGKKHSSFLVVFTAFSVVATINAQKVNNLLTGFTGLTGLGGVNFGFLNSADSLEVDHTVTSQSIANRRDVSDTDIARGWEVESVATNAVSFAMPEDAALVGNWHIHGARSSFGNNRVDLGEWRFPLGTNGEAFSSFWYFIDGRIRPTPKDAAREICAVGVPMAAVPGESRLWTKEFLDGSRILTWENFFLGGDTNAPINAQICLSPNGDFSVRSNDVLTVCRRIYPDDFDGDGLANEIDIAPKSYDGDYFGVASPLPEGALESAYCWVDLCVTGTTDKAAVRVTCDGTSDLGDHVIIAKPNQVFRVPLLKGPWYDIESTSPVSVAATSSERVEVDFQDGSEGRIMFVRNPVDLWFENNGNLCVLKSSENVGAQVFDLTGGCCLADITSLGFRWCCDASCNCGGNEHELGATASWEGYSARFFSWAYCTCGENGGDDGETVSSGMSLSVPRVIFTNNNGGAELPDLAPLRLSFVSASASNGFVSLSCSHDGSDVIVWADTNKQERIIMPFQSEVSGNFTTNFYVEGACVSSLKDKVSFTADFLEEEFGEPKMSTVRKTTVYYPIANVINSTVCDNNRICNPSGIIVGSNACFVVEFPDFAPSAEEIVWSVVEGPARFIGGNTGERVYVTADAPDEIVKLRVQVGDCVSRPIEFTAITVEPLSVKTTVWIVRDDRGNNAARTPTEVTNMITEVNRIYEQIGVSFYIDSISYTNRKDWLDISMDYNNKNICDLKKRRDLVDLSKHTGGLELYYINKISGRAAANADAYGIVLSTNATARGLAHELGHAFGSADIYHVKKSDRKTWITNDVACESSAELDWNNGSGCRYYKSGARQSNIICTLLMCGFQFSYSLDMGAGFIHGFNKNDEEGNIDVGFFRSGERRKPTYHK